MTILTLPQQQSLPEIDYTLLEREFDKTKTKVFMGKSAAFLGPLMCSMNFYWTEDIQTAQTNGIGLWWNPRFYLATPPETRASILMHELWHPAYMDMLRRGSRDPEIWNYAADIRINNNLIREGWSFAGFKPWFNFDYEGWVVEDIYDDLIKRRDAMIAQLANPNGGPLPPMPWQQPWLVNPQTSAFDPTDLVEPDETDIDSALAHTIINNVVAATHSAGLGGGGAGSVPGEIETTLKRFLQPKLPWETLLFNFFNELSNQDYSWARPNRRHRDIYLPGLVEDHNGLDHIMCFEDVSGSISDGDAIRFNSEFKYIKERFEPEKITMVQFDTIIQQVDVFHKEDPFDEVKIVGRGGTSLVCVRDYIIEHEPTAVVIFTDLQCEPMEPLPAGMNIPIIWIGLNNPTATVKTGQLVHFRE